MLTVLLSLLLLVKSSLNSEKFAVNVDALEESELSMLREFAWTSVELFVSKHLSLNVSINCTAANPRYPTQNDTFTAKSYDQDDNDEEPDANNDYGDEGFELDQTTVGGINLAPMSSYSESYIGKTEGFDTSKSDAEAPFVSQFDKMKVRTASHHLLSVSECILCLLTKLRTEFCRYCSQWTRRLIPYLLTQDERMNQQQIVMEERGVASTLQNRMISDTKTKTLRSVESELCVIAGDCEL